MPSFGGCELSHAFGRGLEPKQRQPLENAPETLTRFIHGHEIVAVGGTLRSVLAHAGLRVQLDLHRRQVDVRLS